MDSGCKYLSNNKKTVVKSLFYNGFFSDPGGTRTPNRQNRNLLFYPLNYEAGKPANLQLFFDCESWNYFHFISGEYQPANDCKSNSRL